MSETEALQPFAFESRDLDEIEAHISRNYSALHIGAGGADARARIERHVLTPEVGFDDLDYDDDLSIGYTGHLPEQFIFSDVLTGTVDTVDADGVTRTFGPGEQFLANQPGLPCVGAAHGTRQRAIVINSAILARVAGVAESPHFLEGRPGSADAAARLRQAVGYVRDHIPTDREPDAAATPSLVAATAAQHLAACLLDVYPHTLTGHSALFDGRDATPGTVRRALAHIEAHPQDDLTLADLAAAACVTPRALQLAFHRHLSTSPMRYLQRVRLDHARRELLAAAPGEDTSITRIAARWGFSGSHFTRQYKTVYGETPSQTLHR